MSICMQCGSGYGCKHQAAAVAIARKPEPTATEQAVAIRRAVGGLRDVLDPATLEQLPHDVRVDLWVALKRAANTAYSITKDLDTYLLAEADGSRGFVDSSGTPVEVKRRWETELLNEDEFSAWCADRGVDPFETKVGVAKAARDEVKRALLDDGAKVPGVSAGFSNPYLSLGRR